MTSQAPGRICLFGDHQDYLELPIIACAINRFVTITGNPNGKPVYEIELPDLAQFIQITPEGKTLSTDQNVYLASVVKTLVEEGHNLRRCHKVRITGEIPINAGLSSSSALTVAWTNYLLNAANPTQPPADELARLSFKAEVTKLGGSGGKMDQFAISFGNAIYLETDEQNKLLRLALPDDLCMVIGESGIPKATDGVLSLLKNKALQAIEEIGNKVKHFNIREVELKDIPYYKQLLSEDLAVYFEAAVANHHITQLALRELRSPDPSSQRIGEIMDQHHFILKNNLKLTLPRIDAIINATKVAGALGAKIVGSGRGGSVVAMAYKGSENDIISAIKKAGAIDAYAVELVEGPKIFKN